MHNIDAIMSAEWTPFSPSEGGWYIRVVYTPTEGRGAGLRHTSWPFQVSMKLTDDAEAAELVKRLCDEHNRVHTGGALAPE